MDKLNELNEAFRVTKSDGTVGERIATKTINVMTAIDDVLVDFVRLQAKPELMARLANSAGYNHLAYAMAVAGILSKVKQDVIALAEEEEEVDGTDNNI